MVEKSIWNRPFSCWWADWDKKVQLSWSTKPSASKSNFTKALMGWGVDDLHTFCFLSPKNRENEKFNRKSPVNLCKKHRSRKYKSCHNNHSHFHLLTLVSVFSVLNISVWGQFRSNKTWACVSAPRYSSVIETCLCLLQNLMFSTWEHLPPDMMQCWFQVQVSKCLVHIQYAYLIHYLTTASHQRTSGDNLHYYRT